VKLLAGPARRLFPAHCRLCAAPVALPRAAAIAAAKATRAAAADRELCAACRAELPRNRHPCPRCARPLADAAAAAGPCGSCLRRPPGWRAACVPFVYAAPCDFLVARLKFNRELACARLLGELLADALLAATGDGAPPAARLDAILPVPLHPRRLRERGFNQSREIARTVGARLGLPVAAGLARRSRDNVPQRLLSRAARRQNMRGAFAADAAVRGRRLAILDDVVTTGATATALAAALRRAGALEVELWALARVP